MPSPTTSTASYNVDNELTNWDGNALTYYANGNMKSDSVNTYTWNARNELSSISGLYSASFEYDPFGRRLQKTINGTTTDYLYDGVNPVQELSGTTVTANMLTGLGVDEYFTRTDSTGTSDFLDNALGSTIALADTTGAVQTEYTYSPFGGTTLQGAANANSYQFTGRENDGQGLYYYRARYYDPTLSRFIGEDPARLASGGVNFYPYVGDSPTVYVDPFGLHRKPVKKNPLKRRPLTWLQRTEHALNPGSPAPPTPKGCEVARAAATAVNGPAVQSLIESGLIWLGLGEATGEEAAAAAATGTSKAEGSATEIGKALSPGYAVGGAIVAASGCGP